MRGGPTTAGSSVGATKVRSRPKLEYDDSETILAFSRLVRPDTLWCSRAPTDITLVMPVWSRETPPLTPFMTAGLAALVILMLMPPLPAAMAYNAFALLFRRRADSSAWFVPVPSQASP